MINCRNCGAPHNNILCDYCGTTYGKLATKQLFAKQNGPKIKSVFELSKWKKILIIVLGVVISVVVVGLVMRNKHLRTKIN